MARVMLDIDGVLRNWIDAWRKKWEEAYGYLPEEFLYWEYPYAVAESEGFSYIAARELFFRTWGWELTCNAEPYPGAKSIVDALKDAGHTVLMVTDQSTDESKAGTLAWLSKHFILPDQVTFTERKYYIPASYYIDDHDRQLWKLALHRPKSTVVRMLRPYNARYKYDGTGIKTIEKLSDYLRIIEDGEHQA